MMSIAHAGEYVANQGGLGHNFIKYFVISLIGISIIFLLAALASKSKIAPKKEEESNE